MRTLIKGFLILALLLVGAAQAKALVSCNEAKPGEECSLIPPEDLEAMEAEEEKVAKKEKAETLPSSPNAPGDTVMLIVSGNEKLPKGIYVAHSTLPKKLFAPKPRLQQPKNYGPSPLSKSGI